MASLLNRAKVRQLTLEAAKSRAQPFTRVSKEFLDRIEANLINMVYREVQALPSAGRTIK